MKAINKDLIREIVKTKSKFLSIMIMMFLGVFIFVGLKETSPVMRNTFDKALEQHNMYDIRVTNSFGIDNGDIEEVKKLDNIKILETYYNQNYKIKNSALTLDVESLTNELATPKLIKGNLPQKDDEIALVDSLESKYKIGDIVDLEESKSDEKKLKRYSYKVVGYVHGADHIEISSNNPTNENYFGYTKKENFDFENFSGVNIKLENISYKYSDTNYITEVNKSRDKLIDVLDKRKVVNEEKFKQETSERIKVNEQKIASALNTLEENKIKLEPLKAVDKDSYEKQYSKIIETENQLLKNRKELEISKRSFSDTNYPRFSVENIRGLPNHAQFIDSSYGLNSLANIFSIFLFAVSVLVSLTTLTRMIDENRTNIGTLKALGYSNGQISKKYYIYGVVSTVIGTILGIIGAYLVIIPIVYNAYNRVFTLKEPIITYSFTILALAFLISILCITLAIFIPLRKNLREKTAYLLRPKAPANGSKILLENFTFLWKRLSFLRKVTFRNIFRYKIRMLMTIFGVAGCLTLMFIGFSIRFGIVDISNEQFKVINRVDISATYNPYIDKEDVEKIQKVIENDSSTDKFSKINVQKATIEKNHDVLDTVQVITLDRDNYADYITLKDDVGNIELPKDMVAISEKLAYLHNISIGDNLNVIINEKEYTFKVGVINKQYFGHTVYLDRSYYEKIFNKDYTDNSFIIKTGEDVDKTIRLSDKLQNTENIVNVSNNSKIQEILDNFVDTMDVIVVVMVLCSLTLALVVLYNLINVNVSERLRELSTIKVLGFYPKEVTIYVFREIFYLSVVGILIGNYLGYKLYLKIILDLAARGMMFSSKIPIVVYLLSSGITILIIVVVMIIMHKRLKKVNMVESLKGVE